MSDKENTFDENFWEDWAFRGETQEQNQDNEIEGEELWEGKN